MALILRALAARRDLGLRVRAGADGLDRAIAWVHPTELADPTAFLDGGELLLTTGLALGGEPLDGYVRRLVSAGVAGVGFGSGLSHAEVPPALVRAAERAGLPLLEVPRATPFIAITKAVSAAVAADTYAAVVRTGRGQQELTRTALRHREPGALVRTLARLVDGWVLLLDGDGGVREAAPAAARARGEGLRGELGRVRGGALLVPAGDGEAVVQALGARTRGFLAAGRATGFDAADQHVIATAAALLSLSQERQRSHGTALRGLRTGLARLLLGGQATLAADTIAAVFGPLPAPPWPVVVLTGPRRARAAAAEALEDGGHGGFFAEHDDTLVVLADERATGLPHRITGLHAGVSPSTADVAAGYRQARRAAEAARAGRTAVLRYAEHAATGLAGLLGRDATLALADELLAPLREHDRHGRGELVRSLRCWLEHNGHTERAAARLGVHRHTLRNRMAKVAELTGRDLDAPGTRAELWVALSAVDEF
ncbi:PucR family transcriptional regulator [Prauserella muralis]|uniref:PucR family transcriptional regulator n=1 Tax=Prauserella muralis TaxID=588067 RepID=A0A2V4BB62_9PSEU|nr:PucR family transcriptional regulator [Prauserella muralis]PXY32528.1 PucR family transcriptional regulator [Prauserella muralis]TWE23766.1 purine catabolism regulator [Prauserella muralis]